MEKYLIPNLRNACQLLKTLAHGSDPRRLADLTRSLKLPPTSALRIARTLEAEGFLRRDRGELRLGPSLIYLGNAALSDTQIQDEAHLVLADLTEKTSETSHIALPCDHRSLIVAVHDSSHPLRAASRPGTLTDLHCSSTGKIFLAYTFYDELDTLLPTLRLTRRTPNTLVDLKSLRQEIELTRKRGFSTDSEEIHMGVRCLAAPVRGADQTVVAAIGITAAAARFSPADVNQFAAQVQAAAAELSRRLGSG